MTPSFFKKSQLHTWRHKLLCHKHDDDLILPLVASLFPLVLPREKMGGHHFNILLVTTMFEPLT